MKPSYWWALRESDASFAPSARGGPILFRTRQEACDYALRQGFSAEVRPAKVVLSDV